MYLKEAIDIVSQHDLEMLAMADAGIMAVAVGAKGGGPIEGAKDFTVSAFVPEKVSNPALARRRMLAFHDVYTASTGRRPTVDSDIEVIESGGAFEVQPLLAVPAAQAGAFGGSPAVIDTQKSFVGLRMGIGITNPVATYPAMLSVGTLGFFMRDPADDLYIVSNNHVIGAANAATIGDAIVQPGTLDLTAAQLAAMPTLATLTASLKVANLSGSVQLQPQTAANVPVNWVDAAVAKVVPGRRSGAEADRLCFGGGLLGLAPDFALDQNGLLAGSSRVFKVGRTTGYTEGVVTHIAGSATLNYGTFVAHFRGQVVVRATVDNGGPFSQPGDSGSCVINDAHQAVGLIFAGSPQQSLVNPMSRVLSELSKVKPGLQLVHL